MICEFIGLVLSDEWGVDGAMEPCGVGYLNWGSKGMQRQGCVHMGCVLVCANAQWGMC